MGFIEKFNNASDVESLVNVPLASVREQFTQALKIGETHTSSNLQSYQCHKSKDHTERNTFGEISSWGEIEIGMPQQTTKGPHTEIKYIIFH